MTPNTTYVFHSPSRLIALATTLAAIILYFVPAPADVPPDVMKGLALSLFAVGLYATGALPEHVSALCYFTVAMIVAVAPANVVFSGFHSGAFWLVFGGLVIGVAVQKTGLGARLARAVTSKFATSYRSMVIGMVVVGVALAFVMPSTMGRIVLLIPVVLALCEHVGFGPKSTERAGLVLAAACGTWMPATAILPSNVPNMVLAGIAERMFDITFTYGSYMLIHMPINGIFKAICVIVAILVLFPSRRDDAAFARAPENLPEPLSADGRKLAIILIVTLGLWATDFIHHISPAWIAMAAAMLCMMPGVDLISADDFKTKVNFPSAIYVAGILGLGAVLVETGAGDFAGDWLLTHVPLSPDQPLMSLFSTVGLGMAVNMASTAPSVAAVVGPMADEIAALTGFPINTVLMAQVISYSSVVLPYQVPPLVVGLSLGGVSTADGAKMTATLAAISLVVLVPLNYLWWSWLGMI